MNENCCLCICFTELYFFYWLLVVSLVILIAVPIVFSRSVNIACRSTQNAARIKRFLRLHIVIKPLHKKKHNKFHIILKRNSINVHCKFGARQTWEPAGRIGDFGHFFNGFAKSPRLIVLNIDWVQFALKSCEILHSVRGLYDK